MNNQSEEATLLANKMEIKDISGPTPFHPKKNKIDQLRKGPGVGKMKKLKVAIFQVKNQKKVAAYNKWRFSKYEEEL